MVNGADFSCLPEADLPDPAHHRSPDESDGSGESAERDGGSLRKRCRRQDRRGAGARRMKSGSGSDESAP